MNFSEKSRSTPAYVHADLAKKIQDAAQNSGRAVVNLTAGIPTFPPHKLYIEKLQEYVGDPTAYFYPPYGATTELSEAIRGWYRGRYGVPLEENELYPLLGSKDGIAHLPLVILDKGDEMLVPDPGYPAFGGTISLFDGVALPYSIMPGKEPINFDELESKVSGRTKAIWVNFPSNPTGITVDKNVLVRIVEFARKHGLWVLYDNAYAEVTFDGFTAPSILQIPGAKEVAVELGSFSKTFSFAGFRMGWIVGNAELIAGLRKVKSQVDSGMALPLQRLGAFALSNFNEEWHAAMVQEYAKRRDIVASYLKSLGCTFDLPRGGLYIWAEVPPGVESGQVFADRLLNETQVAVTPGLAFGTNGRRFVRASFSGDVFRLA